MAMLAGLAIALAAATALAQPAAGIDLRILAAGGVLARTGGPPGGGGERVRLVSTTGAMCDGTLAPYASTEVESLEGERSTAIVAPVRGAHCAGSPLFAILRPAPASTWPTSIAATDPRAAAVIETARAAAASAGHLRGAVTWEPPRAYVVGDAVYALVSGPACGEDDVGCSPTVAAVARARSGAAPEVVLARPAHWLWTHDELIDASFGWNGIVDVDGDGTIELVETLMGESAFMIRLVRPSVRPAGEVAWIASYRDDVLDATVGRAPRPVAPAMR